MKKTLFYVICILFLLVACKRNISPQATSVIVETVMEENSSSESGLHDFIILDTASIVKDDSILTQKDLAILEDCWWEKFNCDTLVDKYKIHYEVIPIDTSNIVLSPFDCDTRLELKIWYDSKLIYSQNLYKETLKDYFTQGSNVARYQFHGITYLSVENNVLTLDFRLCVLDSYDYGIFSLRVVPTGETTIEEVDYNKYPNEGLLDTANVVKDDSILIQQGLNVVEDHWWEKYNCDTLIDKYKIHYKVIPIYTNNTLLPPYNYDTRLELKILYDSKLVYSQNLYKEALKDYFTQGNNVARYQFYGITLLAVENNVLTLDFMLCILDTDLDVIFSLKVDPT